MNLSRMMIDRMFIEGRDGARSGPFKTRFGSETLLVFQDALRIAEGGRIIQPLSDGSELAHAVEGFSFNPARGKIPAHFSIRIVRASASAAAPAAATDSGMQELAARLQWLEQAIDGTSFSVEQKSEARRLLQALVENKVVAAILGRTG